MAALCSWRASGVSIGMRALRPSLLPVTHAFSTAQDPPKFDAELTALYTKLSSNHLHPKGPWPLMVQKIQDLRLQPGASVLDLASGPGEPAMSIAKALPSITILSTDVSEDMVATARKRLADTASGADAPVGNMTVELADLENLPFDDARFDAVTCCYGYMFPEDKAKALRETLRVLKPGGKLVATTWDRVDMIPLLRDVMTAVLGKVPPPPPLNPMSLAADGMFESLVRDAGFVDLVVERSTYPFDFGSDKEFQYKVGTLLAQTKIEELGKQEVAREAFWANVDKYAVFQSDGTMLLPENVFKLTVAVKPSA